MSDFAAAAARVARLEHGFLMAGRRWDLDVREPLAFDATWEQRLRADTLRRGVHHPPSGIDYFVFSRRQFQAIPPLAIGRMAWDNWLLYTARAERARLIDATRVVMIVHQRHDYDHVPGGLTAIMGEPARRNLELAGGPTHVFTLRDATHELTPAGLRRTLDPWHAWRHLVTLGLFYPILRRPARIFSRVHDLLRPWSGRLGIGARREARLIATWRRREVEDRAASPAVRLVEPPR